MHELKGFREFIITLVARFAEALRGCTLDHESQSLGILMNQSVNLPSLWSRLSFSATGRLTLELILKPREA